VPSNHGKIESMLKRPTAVRRNRARPLQNPMKISVYPRGANPLVDRHIQRKSLHYATEQVEVYGAAEWVDPQDHLKGIICRDRLFFGPKIERVLDATPEEVKKLTQGKLRSALPPVEVAGCKFIGPAMQKNDTLPQITISTLLIAAPNWDWTMEPATA
jgi:hypothetical protein